MSTEEKEQKKYRGPFEEVKPRWLLENALGLSAGLGVGYLVGGAATHGIGKIPFVRNRMAGMDPKKRAKLLKGISMGTGALGAGALNHARAAFSQRIIDKRRERDRQEREQEKREAQDLEKAACILPLFLVARLR